MNRYFTAALLALTGTAVQAQMLSQAPRLVVNITIDQLRTDYIEQFASFYGQDGFKKLLTEARVYEAASYPFAPIDRASAITDIVTGTSPYYHYIPGVQWLDRKTLRPMNCVDDSQYGISPKNISSSTVSDELKMSTNGSAIVYGIAADKESAVLSAGHAANGAFWMDENTHSWRTSTYYPEKTQKWIRAYNSGAYLSGNKKDINSNIVDISLHCIQSQAMGRDDTPDILFVTLSAATKGQSDWHSEMESRYMELDRSLSRLISKTEETVGKDRVLFVLTSTGYAGEEACDYQKYKIPTGTFYINRATGLLNMYLAAIYGQGKYIEASFRNHLYFNRQLIEQKQISLEDILSRSKDFLMQVSGVRNVLSSPYHPSISGDLIIDVTPGWKLFNEDTNETYISRLAYVPFPIIFYGAGMKAERILIPVTVDRIAPTIAKSIRIRAPNACSSAPLF